MPDRAPFRWSPLNWALAWVLYLTYKSAQKLGQKEKK